jgi:hypothetical protein
MLFCAGPAGADRYQRSAGDILVEKRQRVFQLNRLPVAIRNLTPHLDFDYAQYLSAHRNTSAPDFELTPAAAWLNPIFEANVGVRVGIKHSSSTNGAVAPVWLVGV